MRIGLFAISIFSMCAAPAAFAADWYTGSPMSGSGGVSQPVARRCLRGSNCRRGLCWNWNWRSFLYVHFFYTAYANSTYSYATNSNSANNAINTTSR